MTRVRRPRSVAADPRRARIDAYGLLGVEPREPALEELVRRACEATGVAIAWLSLFDGERERMVAAAGIAPRELAHAESFAFAPGSAPPFFMEDARRSPFKAHPWVGAARGVRFIGAVPLVTPEGLAVGSLTVLDRVPRVLSAHALSALENLDRKSTRLNSSHIQKSRMPSSA